MAFQKAVKTKAKLRLALCGLAGCGKTFTALKVASEISKHIRAAGLGDGRIAVIDSERGSASLYADEFDFDVCELDSFSPMAYVEKIKDAEQAGYDIIVADSLSHAWAGKDGALDQIADGRGQLGSQVGRDEQFRLILRTRLGHVLGDVIVELPARPNLTHDAGDRLLIAQDGNF